MGNASRIVAATAAVLLASCESAGPLGPHATSSSPLASVFSADGVVADFTGTDVTVALVDPGVAVLKPAAAPQQLVIRGLTALSRTEATDPRVTGNTTVVANGVLSLIDGTGPVSGTFRTEVDQGGVWEGRWHGFREMTGPSEWKAALKLVGDGHGGAIDGMKIAYTNTVTTFEIIPAVSVGVIEGRIGGR